MKDKVEKKEPVFEAAALIQAAAEFATSPEIMAGALYGLTEPITKTKAQEQLESYLKRPINDKEV